METLNVNVNATILRPVEKVFQAIINPAAMTHYFISQSNGIMATGAKLVWIFADVGARCEVQVLQVVENEKINFRWNAIGAEASEVSMVLTGGNDGQTTIAITESAFPFSQEGVRKALGQPQGWTDFTCSLKAWLYAGINLRNGQSTGQPE